MLSGISSLLRLNIDLALPFDTVFVILGGYYINLYSFPLLKYISPFYYENSGLSYIIWNNVDKIGKIILFLIIRY